MIQVVSDIASIRERCKEYRSEGKNIALVPTMGALHEGHLSLLDKAAEAADIVVASIYVNPTQFAPTEDFENYPRDLDSDVKKMESRGADLVFAPTDSIMYPEGYSTYVSVEGLTEGLCGRSRPMHFRGVTTIVAKLFQIIQPKFAVFGQKDAQQVAVIRRMTDDLNIDVTILSAPIVRESDGLAMSSRNAYLSPAERSEAPVLYKSLQDALGMAQKGVTETDEIRGAVLKRLAESPIADVEYAEIVDNRTLKPVEYLQEETLIALAVRFGGTRLIDNIVIKRQS